MKKEGGHYLAHMWMASLSNLTWPEASATGTCHVARMVGLVWGPSMLPWTSPGPSVSALGRAVPCSVLAAISTKAWVDWGLVRQTMLGSLQPYSSITVLWLPLVMELYTTLHDKT